MVFIPLAHAKGKRPKDQQTKCKMRSEANATSQQPKAKEPKSQKAQEPKANKTKLEEKSHKPKADFFRVS